MRLLGLSRALPSEGRRLCRAIVRCWSFLSIEQCFAVRSADTFGFTPSELRTLRSLRTPAGIQKFLDDLPYNLGYTPRSPKRVLHDRVASCLEGALFAAAALRILGFPPLIFDLEAEQDTDHDSLTWSLHTDPRPV